MRNVLPGAEMRLHHRSMRWTAVLLGVLLVAACTAQAGSPTAGQSSRSSVAAVAPTSASPSPLAPGLAAVADDPEAGLTGELLQFRRHVEARRVQIRLTARNAGLVVESVRLEVAGLAAAPADPKGAELRAGAALDFPVVLGTSDCTRSPGPPRARVRVRDATGGSREVAVPLVDHGLARRLHEGDCAERDLLDQVAIEAIAVGPVTADEEPALRLTVRLRRVGGTDPVRITGLGSNTVYSVTATDALPTLVDGAETFDLLLVPARCDVHALGESYRTSLIGLVIALGDGPPRPFVLTPEPAVRRQLETFAVETCRAGQD